MQATTMSAGHAGAWRPPNGQIKPSLHATEAVKQASNNRTDASVHVTLKAGKADTPGEGAYQTRSAMSRQAMTDPDNTQA